MPKTEKIDKIKQNSKKRISTTGLVVTQSSKGVKRVKATSAIEKDATADDDGYESDDLDANVEGGGVVDDNEEDEEDDDDDDEYEEDDEDEGLDLAIPEPSLSKANDQGGKSSKIGKGSKNKDVGNEDEEDDDEQIGSEVLINVDFSFKDPHEIDFKSVRRLLINYVPAPIAAEQASTLEASIFDSSGMSECIVAQRVLGTMIKIDDDLDVYSFATILPVSRYRESSWMGSVKSFVLGHCKDAKKKKQLSDLFAGSSLGLLVNERMLNVPAELSPILIENLERDLQWVKNESALKEDRSTFSSLSHVLLLAPCWMDATPNEELSKSSSSSVATTAARSNFLHYEEEIFAQEALLDFEVKEGLSVSSSSSSSSSKGSSSLRRPQSKRVIVLPLSVLPKCVLAIKERVKRAEVEEKIAGKARKA